MARFSARKDVQKSGLAKYRVKVKAFKTSQAMHEFLNKQDNSWKAMPVAYKSGIYIERGLPAELINIRDIDPSALAHM